MFEKIEELERRFEEIQAELSAPEVVNDQARFRKLMKEQTDMGAIVEKYREYKKTKQTISKPFVYHITFGFSVIHSMLFLLKVY